MLDPESGCDVWKPMEDEFSDRARPGYIVDHAAVRGRAGQP